MSVKNTIVIAVAMLCANLAVSQSYNRDYVKNLKYRLLISCISETRELNSLIMPAKKFDAEGKEALNLRNSPNVYSGFLFQTGNVSCYWAASAPQSKTDMEKFGKQSANLSKVSFLSGPLLFNFNYVNQKGLYDDNYIKHPEFEGDTQKFRRHNTASFRWISADFSYYPASDKMCLGVPAYFGERQLKSKFSLGYCFSYNFTNFFNNGKSFFRDTFIGKNPELNVISIRNNVVSFAVTPTLYLVSKSKLFFYTEASMGFGIGQAVLNYNNKKPATGQFELPQAKVATGINSDRFLAGVYYTYLNRTIKAGNMTIGNILGNWGFILGFRFNQYKYRYLKWDTI